MTTENKTKLITIIGYSLFLLFAIILGSILYIGISFAGDKNLNSNEILQYQIPKDLDIKHCSGYIDSVSTLIFSGSKDKSSYTTNSIFDNKFNSLVTVFDVTMIDSQKTGMVVFNDSRILAKVDGKHQSNIILTPAGKGCILSVQKSYWNRRND